MRGVALLLTVAALAGCAGADDGSTLLRPGRSLEARADVAPRTSLFGDTLKAHLVVAVDRRRIDPAKLDVRTAFAPFEQIGEVERSRRDIGDETQLVYTFTLRCDDFLCLPRGSRLPFRFRPAVVGSRRVNWPPIEVATRINESELNAFRYRATLTPLPQPTYRISPRALAASAFSLAAILFLAAATIGVRVTRRAWRHRSHELDLPPVERALVLLRWTRDGEDRRRALELLAEALESEARGDLARASRKLAWSDEPPSAAAAEQLGRRIEEERRVAA